MPPGGQSSRAVDTREETAAWIISQAKEGEVRIGLDFAFGFPAWFARERGCRSIDDVWRMTATHGESWLSECSPPFWGRPGRARPDIPNQWRATENAVRAMTGFSPRSVFQIGGAGAVGTGSIRGMPLLASMRKAGLRIWPFDLAEGATLIEIYPRILTGTVIKKVGSARSEYLARYWPELQHEPAAIAASSDDAFDALVSALVMCRYSDDLAELWQPSDSIAPLEGEIWQPPRVSAAIGGYMGESYEIEGDNSSVLYRRFERGYQLSEERQVVLARHAWSQFLHELEAFGVWSWEARYEDPGVVDGTSWSLSLIGRGKRIVSNGTNAYPAGFDGFCEAVSRLVGDLPFR